MYMTKIHAHSVPAKLLSAVRGVVQMDVDINMIKNKCKPSINVGWAVNLKIISDMYVYMK